MKRVIPYGTYDVLHYGHINLLKQVKLSGVFCEDIYIPRIPDISAIQVKEYIRGEL